MRDREEERRGGGWTESRRGEKEEKGRRRRGLKERRAMEGENHIRRGRLKQGERHLSHLEMGGYVRSFPSLMDPNIYYSTCLETTIVTISTFRNILC